MPHKPLVVVPGDEPWQIADSPQLERLRGHADVRLFRTAPSSPSEQIERVADADIIINSRNQVRWPGDLLRQLPKLRCIALCSIGTDSIDLETARARGIVVCNVPGRTAGVVAEHALALLLAVARDIPFRTAELKSGRWSRCNLTYLGGKTLGVIGTGAIGATLARLARGIGMNVVAWTFHPSEERGARLGLRYVPLDELLATSDAVSLHVRASPQSRHLIGRRELALMKPGSLLINSARGMLVDSTALVDALRSGHLGGAGLDVFDPEPLPADHPLLSCDRVALTPHAADQTPEGTDFLNAGAVDNVLAFLGGTPTNVVT